MKSKLLSQIPGISHGFGTRLEPVVSEHRELYDHHRPHWKQVHGTSFAEIKQPNQQCGEIDAQFSFWPGNLVTVMTADCVPVLMSRKDGGAVAAIHAGWRGTLAHITRKLWAELASRGENPKDWVASIGPTIGGCCYEVSPELIENFKKEFPSFDWKVQASRPRYLALPEINALELRSLGIHEVEIIPFCTRCSKDATGPLFFSHRRHTQGDAEDGRQWSSLAISK